MDNIYAKSGPEWTLLSTHLQHVIIAVKKFASYLGMEEDIARNGAILHDIGKAHPFFQDRLKGKSSRNKVFRHEIASLFFLSAFPQEQRNTLIEMVVAHHKSVKGDISEKGLLDMEEYSESYIEFHLGNWEKWSLDAIRILREAGVACHYISRGEAIQNIEYCLAYCENAVKQRGYSEWRGLLMGADHFASALIDKTKDKAATTFQSPDLKFYNREHPLYPLSYKDASSEKKHTIVVASTGAGKTDYLFRRCRRRVFYTLPFQASINAMYKRVANDLENENPNLDIRVQHSSSCIVKRNDDDDPDLQNLFGASVKILTPHQLAIIAFGLLGYEALILDIKGCDIILDEVHTYSGVSQALVLKLIEVLKRLDCRIHVGTATMPSILYNRIKDILDDDVLEVKLSDEEKEKFNRHIIHKIDSFEEALPIIQHVVESKQKILIVLNKVKNAQDTFDKIQELYPDVPKLLLHSRFKRKDRNEKERLLLGLDETGKATGTFNTSEEACIVISTQIVEVSLDISFDVMFTETAPLDALIQRFGRINRKRNKDTIGKYKDVYIVKPNENPKETKPYDADAIYSTFDVLENGRLLDERDLQHKIDQVFTSIDFLNIEEHSVFKTDGRITLDKLTHNGKSILFDLLDIESVVCVLESDVNTYENTTDLKTRLELEIPVYYYSVANMQQSEKGNKPFIIPDKAYNTEKGLDASKIKEEYFNVLNRFL
ncbi:CRISPR-associated helicase, Cas3 family [Porphyromonadaceae bacterium KH3CP3RA]|nr:CRISPR-associated helicase, Cas3 family [Porphyromonadaceae bacterium KH3CP3RA]